MVLRKKVTLSLLILKEEWSQMNNLRFYFNKLGAGGSTQRKLKKWRVEINKRATKISEAKITKLIARMIKKIEYANYKYQN